LLYHLCRGAITTTFFSQGYNHKGIGDTKAGKKSRGSFTLFRLSFPDTNEGAITIFFPHQIIRNYSFISFVPLCLCGSFSFPYLLKKRGKFTGRIVISETTPIKAFLGFWEGIFNELPPRYSTQNSTLKGEILAKVLQ
jgi:hypothetical protein